MRDLIPRYELNTMANSWFNSLWTELDNYMFPSVARKSQLPSNKFSYPKINIQNLEKEYVIEAAVPGLTKDNVKVEYVNGVLTISGKKQKESNSTQEGYVIRELHKSSFSRSVSVDEELCDVENIDAGVENGVLTVKIPKKVLDTAVPKRIIEVR